MSNYAMIQLEKVCKSHFVVVDHGDKSIWLAIHTGRDYQSALLSLDQAIDLANMLLDAAREVKKIEAKGSWIAVNQKEGEK